MPNPFQSRLAPLGSVRQRGARGTTRQRFRRRLAVLVLALIALGGLAAVATILLTPSGDDLPVRVDAVLRANHATRTPLQAIPRQQIEALVAIEDERFFKHHGIDLQGLTRALFADLYHRRPLEGGSTLTQQLVKNLYMDGHDDGWRKPENLVVTLKIEARFSKQQILEAYLNSVYFGHGAWGIGQAADVYFRMTPDRLDLARASMLAGLPQSPSYYDLYRNPCAARARQFNVLAQMVHDGYLSAEQAAAAYNESIGYPCK